MKFSSQFIEQVVQATDILQLISSHGISVIRGGSNYKALCPFHNEKTPSFNISPHKGYFHCFGCHKSGDAITFLMLYHNLTFPEAVEDLANRNGIPIEKTAVKELILANAGIQLLEKSAEYYHSQLMDSYEGKIARDYLAERDLPQELWKIFKLGYSPPQWNTLYQKFQDRHQTKDLLDTGLVKLSQNTQKPYDHFRHRLMFPIHDAKKRCIGFGGRILPSDFDATGPKYLNSPETRYYHKSRVLYGFAEGNTHIRQKKRLIFVEGYFDVLRLHQFGFQEAVATCGTALTEEHIRFIQRYVDQVILLFDGDLAGQEAAMKSAKLFLNYSLQVSIVTLPEQEDPDTFLLNYGKQEFEEQLQRGIPFLDFFIQQALAKFPANVQGRTKVLEELIIPEIRQIHREEMKHMILHHVAEQVGVPLSTLQKMTKSLQTKGKTDIVENLYPSSGDLNEKRIIQSLLASREMLALVREHIQTNELITPLYREILQEFYSFPNEEFVQTSTSDLRKKISSQLYEEIMKIDLEADNAPLRERDVKRFIGNIKKRNLRAKYQPQLQSGSEQEKRMASLHLRKQEIELKKLYSIR